MELAENVKEVSSTVLNIQRIVRRIYCFEEKLDMTLRFHSIDKCWLASIILQLINPEVQIITVENTPDDPRQRKPDITKAKEVLGWEPKVKLRDGLPLMESDFRERLGIQRKVWSPVTCICLGHFWLWRIQLKFFEVLGFVAEDLKMKSFLVFVLCIWLDITVLFYEWEKVCLQCPKL